MCDDLIKCTENDPRLKYWVIKTVRDDLQSNILSKILAIVAILLAKYSDNLITIIKEVL